MTPNENLRFDSISHDWLMTHIPMDRDDGRGR